MRLTFRVVSYLLLDSFLLVTSLVNTPNVVERPGAPFEVVERGGKAVVGRIYDASASNALMPGDVLRMWHGVHVTFAESIEYLTDRESIGTQVMVGASREGASFETSILLVPYYRSLRFLVVSIFVGLTAFGVGIFILLIRPGDIPARVLHWALVTLGATIINTWGAIDPDTLGSIIVRSAWWSSYLGVAVSFLMFTLVFPTMKIPRLAHLSWVFLPTVACLGVLLSSFQMSAVATASMDDLSSFQTLFDIFHASLFVFVGGGLFNIARATMRASTDAELRRMYWILLGLSLGAAPYLILHILPQLVASQYFVPEEFTTIFFLAIPASFAIAVLKYHLFDVEVMINRTITYAVLTFAIVSGYAFIVLLVASLIGEEVVFERYFAVAALTLVIGLVINPLRLRLQRSVDEILFPARANFRRALTSVSELLQHALNRSQLFERTVQGAQSIVPAGAIGLYETRGELLVCAKSVGAEPLTGTLPAGDLLKDLKTHDLLVKADAVKTSRWPVTNSEMEWSVCVPLRSQSLDVLAVLALKQRQAREKFDEEELTFLLNIATQSAAILERLMLQEKILLAEEERRRLEELSDLKSYFISSVSHELRMPLTSIRMFAEMLRMQKELPAPRKKEYLEIIEGETDRLSRLIGNILDFAKIERGVKEYHFAPVRIDKIARRAVLAMRYQLLQQNARLRVRIQGGMKTLIADGDALEEAMLNLLSNALKYSTGRKEIDLQISWKGKNLIIAVADKGIGIPEAELPNIFDRFYRVRDDRTRQVGGAGLGLAVVKHIVEAHKGIITVESAVGKGSVFQIELPTRTSHTKDKK